MSERYSRFVPLSLVWLSILACYSPVIFATYGIADDFPSMTTGWLVSGMGRLGRGAGALLLTWSYGFVKNIADLSYLRALAVAGICVLGGLILRHLMQRQVEPYLAALVTVLIVTLPPFHIYAAWAQVWYYPFASAATYASYYLFLQAMDRRGWAAGGLYLAGCGILLFALSCYQPAAMFFWFWIAVDMLRGGVTRNEARKLLMPGALFLAVLLVYLGLYKAQGEQSPRAALEFHIGRKLAWFVMEALPPTLRLQAFNYGGPLIALAVLAIIAAGILVNGRGSYRKCVLKAVAFGGLLALSFIPNLASQEYYLSYRTRGALYAIAGLIFWLGLSDILERLAPRMVIPALGVSALISILAANYYITTQAVIPHVLELGVLRTKLYEWDSGKHGSIDVIQGALGDPPPGGPYASDFGSTDTLLPLDWNVMRAQTLQCFQDMYGTMPAIVRVFDAARRPDSPAGVLTVDMSHPAEFAVHGVAAAIPPTTPIPQPEEPPSATVNFDNQIEVLGVVAGGGGLTIRVKLLASVACEDKVLVHSFSDGRVRVWDQKPNPPLCNSKVGEERSIALVLPDEYVSSRDRLELGFFDERDAAHSWPPFPVIGKGNAFCIPAGAGSHAIPLKTCTLSRG